MVGDVEHNYILDGAKIIEDRYCGNTLRVLYDNENAVCGIVYNGLSYYFTKNLQGDIITISDENANIVARYRYDAWGVCTTVEDTSTIGIATINPFRYRGYYLDVETGLYYLQSRYYDPTVGRFINADDVIIIGLNGLNLFSYCNNSPIIHQDPDGRFIRLIQIYAQYYYNKKFEFNSYIYGQANGNASKLRMGAFCGEENGCSWVATYNALCMMNKQIHPAEIIKHFEMTGVILQGVFGVFYQTIAGYLFSLGLRFTVSKVVNEFDGLAQKNMANILFFYYEWGAHYVALRWNGRHYLIYNRYSSDTKINTDFTSLKDYMGREGGYGCVLISIGWYKAEGSIVLDNSCEPINRM